MADVPADPAPADASRSIEALVAAGVPVLVLRGPATGSRNLVVAIPNDRRAAARAVVEPLGWRYAWVRSGLLRILPALYYWWDGGATLTLHWAVPVAPLPGWMLRRLQRVLWQTARRSNDGTFEPDPAALIVWLAVQACRPGRGHEDDWQAFLACLDSVENLADARAIARGIGVSRGLERALAGAANGRQPGRGALFDGVRAVAWRIALAIQAHARPGRVRRLLAGVPALGDQAIRCRVAGVEVRAEPRVFVPTPDADLFVELSLAALDGRPGPAIVEVGTGCGAIALALAAALPDSIVHGIELDEFGVRCARRNARRLRLERVRIHQGSLVDPLPSNLRGAVDLVIANLPFYPTREYAPIGSVPRMTIEGSGDDGLGLLRQLARDARGFIRPGGALLLQMFHWQWEVLSDELAQLGYRAGTARRSGPFVLGRADFIGGTTMRR
jgi:release factor glutamine methyltransferase